MAVQGNDGIRFPDRSEPVKQRSHSFLDATILGHTDDFVLSNATAIETTPVLGDTVENLQGRNSCWHRLSREASLCRITNRKGMDNF